MYQKIGPVNIALLDSGEKVRFESSHKTKEDGERFLSHMKDAVYLGEGIHYSCDDLILKYKEKRHFFTWHK